MEPHIKRRDFLAAASLAAVAAVPQAAASAAEPDAGAARDFYELRLYRLRRGPMPKRADAYFRDALIPACRRAGTGPVGVFGVTVGPDSPSTYVLIPHPSPESFFSLPGKLLADADYAKSGEEFLGTLPTDPPYVGLDVSLLRAFASIPKLELPPGTAKNEPRLFELRTYRSHSERAGVKKVEMFDSGEIGIFRRCGLQPVFFGQSLAGPNLPSLTYMLTYPDMAAREKAWATFRADPDWKKLSSTPGYTDAEIVTNINNVLLAPAAYSQV